MNSYLHIYKVSRTQPGTTPDAPLSEPRYVSVLSLGNCRTQAEQIAINLVHQSGYHILATDTATAAPWLSADADRPYLEDLEHFGASIQELAA